MRSFRLWLANLIRPPALPAPPQDVSDSRFAERFVAITEDFNRQQENSMFIQADLLRQVREITPLLTAASARIVNMEAALKKEKADSAAKIAALEAEAQQLREKESSGAASNIEMAALLSEIKAAAQKLEGLGEGAP